MRPPRTYLRSIRLRSVCRYSSFDAYPIPRSAPTVGRFHNKRSSRPTPTAHIVFRADHFIPRNGMNQGSTQAGRAAGDAGTPSVTEGEMAQRIPRRRRPILRIPRMIYGSAATVADRSPPPSCSSTTAPGLTLSRTARAISLAVAPGAQSRGSTSHSTTRKPSA